MKNHYKKSLYWIIALVFSWRILLFIPLFFSTFVPEVSGYIYDHTSISTFLSSWANFDGVHYLNIALKGYTTEMRFFPLYPLLVKILSWWSDKDTVFFYIAFITSHLLLLLGLFQYYRLIRLDYREKTTWLTIICILIFPTSFFFGSIYSESLFLFLVISSLYYARTKNWYLAGLMAAFASATRVVGLILLPVLIIEFMQTKKKSFVQGIPILLAPLGFIFYSIYCFIMWKNPLLFLHLQGNLQNGRSVNSLVFPLQTIYRYFRMIFTVSPLQYDWWIVMLEFAVFIWGIVLLFLMWKHRIRPSYFVFTILGFSIPILSGTLSGLPRYVLPLFPFFLTIALIKNRWIIFLYAVICLILSFILILFFTRGYYIA